MNKRYIDFVPAKRKPGVSSGVGSATHPGTNGVKPAINRGASIGAAKKVAPKRVEKAWADEEDFYGGEVPLDQMFAEKAPPVGVSTGLPRTRKKTVEDYQPKFVKTEVKKRPLGAQRTGVQRSTGVQRPIGAQKVGAQRPTGAIHAAPVASAAPSATKTAVRPAKMTTKTQGMAKLQPTRAKFLNTNKIVKRPLSRVPYAGKVQATPVSAPNATAESPKKAEKPAIIIAKPEKDSKASLIVAIIITIILGAAAGTVAFLLLPK